jgi:2-C-methyl-D-erythritol 4-phosphate cytidylyltransferase
VTRVIIAISPGDARFAQLPLANHPQITVVDGGAERADSVLAGIQAAGTRSGCWCMTPRVRACIRTICAPAGAERNQQGGRHSGRAGARHHEACRAGQTGYRPHRRARRFMARADAAIFPRELLHDCLTRALKEGATITDEASALEYCGFHPELVEGRADNIKVTRPEDLQLAEFYLTRSTHQEKA